MQEVQVSRGKLGVRLGQSSLLNGELFVDYSRSRKYKTGENDRFDAYELYVGVDGKPLKVGGAGVLSFMGPTDTLPTKPTPGGIYYITQDINTATGVNDSASGKDRAEFRAGDLAIYVGEFSAFDNRDPDEWTLNNIARLAEEYAVPGKAGWIRINNGGGASYEVLFDPDNTNFSPKTTKVQQALVELDRNKLSYGGVKIDASGASSSVIVPAHTDGDAYCTVTVADLFAKMDEKGGVYYSVGTLPENTVLHLITGDGENDYIELDEGDFIAVTSDVTTNDEELTVDDYKFTKIPGGTHDAAKIKYKAGERNDTYESSTDKAWVDADSSVKNVKEALDDLYKSKADLTAYGKIPLTQMPDTALNGMEFVGVYTIPEGQEFTLPTAKDKVHNDEDTEGTELRQGDFFTYSGNRVDLSTFTDAEFLESARGYLNSGDHLVYNGENATPKWSVIDNTSPITGFIVKDNNLNGEDDTDDKVTEKTVLTGEVTFSAGEDRVDHDGGSISEIQLDAEDGHTIKVYSKNAALLKNKESVGTIYRENGDGVLVVSGLREEYDEAGQNTLRINEDKGIILSGGHNPDGEYLGMVRIHQNYSALDSDIDLALPADSGTLARLEDIGLNTGSHFFIPRFNKETNEDGKGTFTLTNSPIEIIDHDTTDGTNGVRGIIFHGNEVGNFKGNKKLIFRASDEDSVQVMPKLSGVLLNTNSIIDCGEWDDNGVHFYNEGAQNTYTSSSKGLNIGNDLYTAFLESEFVTNVDISND